MNLSQGAVHPVEAPQPQTEGAANVPHHRARMKDLQGMPGTVGGLVLRVSQLLSAVVALSVMATTSDFSSASAFCYLVAAVGLQSTWIFVLAIVDAYALLAGRRLQNSRILSLFAVGDGGSCIQDRFIAEMSDNFVRHICFSLCICWSHCSNQQRPWGLS
ncbi:CASP-like protein 5A2 isoform X2 [Primulina eburnea]|uniref:CASP-like protein 5A2 isoform X2 n=1 Tax=Primulina eburnea TaxID=1245227 RepID=UPI003C6BE88F